MSRTVLGPPSLRSRPVFFLPVDSFRILLGESVENILRMRNEVLRAKVTRCRVRLQIEKRNHPKVCQGHHCHIKNGQTSQPFLLPCMFPPFWSNHRLSV